MDWLGQTVRLSFDWDEDEAMEDSLRTAKALMADQEEWNRRVLSRASEDLLELKNDSWLEEDEEELDAEKFEACLELEASKCGLRESSASGLRTGSCSGVTPLRWRGRWRAVLSRRIFRDKNR